MDDDSIKLTREELYERVWSTPATKLAKEFGLVLAGEVLRLRRIEHEEEQRRQREQERRRMEDQERRYYLDQHLKAWSENQRLREFLRAYGGVTRRAEGRTGDGQL